MISDAFVRVECDHPGCGESEEIELTALAGHETYDMRNVRPRLEREGWHIDDDQTFCPECSVEARDE